MQDWRENYKKKLTTPEEAVKHIKSGDRIILGLATGEPHSVVDAMLRNKDDYQNIEIVAMLSLGDSPWLRPEMKGHFKFNCFFASPANRSAISSGEADFTTAFFFEIPDILRTDLKPNVALIQVSPPDKHGYCSFGTSVDYTKETAENADLVIAQVNKNMPRTMGDSFIHINKLDYICEIDNPLIGIPVAPVKETEKKIGQYIAGLVRDGDTLQLGIGGIPNAVLSCLGDKKDLGLHSEMISDGVVDLIESGVINNSKKTIHRFKSVVGFAMGTQKIYDFIDDNPSFEFRSIDYVNDPSVIMQNDNMVAINSCLQVDLLGQIVSDSMGLLQFSGVGGQLDFVRGARMSKGGRAIMAMPATAAKGTVSRIVSTITEGSAVTTTRNDVDYVVTEFGVAKLSGKTLRHRARELIKIAHPDFQDELKAEYKKRFGDVY